jgi:hypothetical protein
MGLWLGLVRLGVVRELLSAARPDPAGQHGLRHEVGPGVITQLTGVRMSVRRDFRHDPRMYVARIGRPPAPAR